MPSSSPEIMALALLCLGLTLLGALQTQAQDSDPNLIPAPSLDRVPLERNFQDDKFQGKWYVLGMAGNEFQKETHSGIKMYSVTYKLEADHSYTVTSTQLSDKGCEYWIGSLVPGSRRGQFNLGNIQSLPNIRSYMVQVVAADFREFAIVFSKKTLGNTEYFKIRLYGRTRKLRYIWKEIFVMFAKSLGLTRDHIIFSAPTAKGQARRRGCGASPGQMPLHHGKERKETRSLLPPLEDDYIAD